MSLVFAQCEISSRNFYSTQVACLSLVQKQFSIFTYKRGKLSYHSYISCMCNFTAYPPIWVSDIFVFRIHGQCWSRTEWACTQLHILEIWLLQPGTISCTIFFLYGLPGTRCDSRARTIPGQSLILTDYEGSYSLMNNMSRLDFSIFRSFSTIYAYCSPVIFMS